MCWASLNRPLKIVVAIKCGSKSKKPGPKKIDRRGNWTPNLRDWNPTRYHCAIRPEAPPCHILHIYNAVGGLKSLSDLVRPKSRCFEHPFELRKNDPIWISIHHLHHLSPSRPTSKKKSFFSLSNNQTIPFLLLYSKKHSRNPTNFSKTMHLMYYLSPITLTWKLKTGRTVSNSERQIFKDKLTLQVHGKQIDKE